MSSNRAYSNSLVPILFLTPVWSYKIVCTRTVHYNWEEGVLHPRHKEEKLGPTWTLRSHSLQYTETPVEYFPVREVDQGTLRVGPFGSCKTSLHSSVYLSVHRHKPCGWLQETLSVEVEGLYPHSFGSVDRQPWLRLPTSQLDGTSRDGFNFWVLILFLTIIKFMTQNPTKQYVLSTNRVSGYT